MRLSEDYELIKRFKNKDLKAFDEIFTRFHKPIYFFVYKMVHNTDTAEDIIQDTFVKVYKGLSKADDNIRLSPWIYRIAHNACVDYIRKHKTSYELLDNVNYEEEAQDSRGEDNPETNYLNIELRNKINKTMSKLNNRYKTILILRDYNDLPYKDIGQILGLSEAAVKSLIHRARLEFQKTFKELS
jgi:RNA polymerase sigma-70 factor (ECF subfamily)